MIKLKSLLEAQGFPNHLRAGFIKLKNKKYLSQEESKELHRVYKDITELLTYGKFYDNKKPNKRRYELSALVADINIALIGKKRLGSYQSRFETIFKKFVNMINTQFKREEKGQKADYIKAIRASQLDLVRGLFINATDVSTRYQKDLI
tara:strand:- start:44 stop:490 length:447 start_codon:yes stop_codon:yes gene_type:complete